ncbi:hypothetical protein [Legionella spiritensis]|uniref:hypothetical protein n=1 Tax=Legionella spiritensis TaxID=452 RepID=UPI000F715ACF|nr:hypothetical protein [Legionella spiritensis]VEG92257.1 Uncharacterised protein [Legionella spiritensis]
MSGKPVDYWRNKYNHHYNKWGREVNVKSPGLAEDWYHASAIFWLLCEYSSASNSGLWGIQGGGRWSRFWSGRWGTHHGQAVTETLKAYKELSGQEQSVVNLLTILKQKLNDKPLNPNGDLSRLLQVVQEKTAITFLDCDTENHLPGFSN